MSEERSRPAGDPAPTLLGQATVARIPYLNAEPFYVRWGSLPGMTVDRVPRLLGEEARRGTVDAGLMAVVDALSLEESFERLGSFGVACDGAVESVLLLHGGSLEGLEGGKIWLTGESSTSARLCRLLLERRLGVRPSQYRRRDFTLEDLAGAPPPQGEAWLLIGDSALRARRGREPSRIFDLGAAWKQWTGQPFVYAVWTVRRELPTEMKQRLEEFLDGSLREGLNRLPELAAAYARKTHGMLGDAAALRAYLERFHYRLGPGEEAGLALFTERLREESS